MEENKILGEKPVSQLLLKFSVPCVMGLLISALYNIVDQIFIGNSELGYLGNAATGISFPIICICNAFAWCVGDGAASYLSICSGRQDSESAHRCVGTGLTTTFIISVILSGVCILFCEPLMVLFGASEATLGLACNYFEIIALFFPAYLMFNVMNSMIRADGSPTYAMVAMCSGAILNIILDPICIFWLDWGIEGAAIATVIGQGVSFIICGLYFFKPKSFKLSKESFHIKKDMLKNFIMLGGSTFIIQISMVVMTLLSNITLAKYGASSIYGSDIPISVFSIQTKVYTIVNNIAVGIALGGQPILGYNYGAKLYARVREALRKAILGASVICIFNFLVIQFLSKYFIFIFTREKALLDIASFGLRINTIMFPIIGFQIISSVYFQAVGKPKLSLFISLSRQIIILIPCIIVMSRLFGLTGIWFAAPTSDFISTVITFILIKREMKTLKHLQKEQEEMEKLEAVVEEN